MTRALIAFALSVIVGLFVLVLLIDNAIGRYLEWREKQALRVRDAQLRKYCISPDLRGTKSLNPPRGNS